MIYCMSLRFLEMHDRVFRYLIAYLSHKRESTSTGSCFYLPKLSFGSFSLASRPETRPLLFVNLMESMLTRARSLFHHIVSVKSTPGHRSSQESFDDLPPIIQPDLALQAIRKRGAAILKSVQRIKATLLRLG